MRPEVQVPALDHQDRHCVVDNDGQVSPVVGDERVLVLERYLHSASPGLLEHVMETQALGLPGLQPNLALGPPHAVNRENHCLGGWLVSVVVEARLDGDRPSSQRVRLEK